jgi:prepilin-type N-terminal cleavage/methylation domain-containing protein
MRNTMNNNTMNKGFTLLEVTIVMALMTIFGLLAFVAVTSTTEISAVADSQTQVQSDLRQVVMLMTEELQLASKTPNNALTPPLQAVRVNRDINPNSPVEIVFQRPLDGSGTNWSQPIRFRFFTEDLNNNAILDPGEDIDGDGVLSRRILRLEDRNGDGAFDGPGETVQVGTANNLAEVDFQIEDSLITITATATKLVGNRSEFPVTATVTSTIYLLN